MLEIISHLNNISRIETFINEKDFITQRFGLFIAIANLHYTHIRINFPTIKKGSIPIQLKITICAFIIFNLSMHTFFS